MQKLLKTYQKRLTNLSTNNKSLLLLRLADKFFLDLHRLDFAMNKPSFSVVENLIAQKKKITLCSNIDSRDEKSNKVANILHQIKRTDRVIQEERGAKDLYVAYPFVQGQMIDGTLVRCPLLYFPVELLLENNEWKIKTLENQAIRWNNTFLLAYSHYNNVSFSEEFLEQDFEEFSKDAQVFRTELYNFIENSPLTLHFNQENFTDHLLSFREFIKLDFVENTKAGELKLMPEAVLGVFPMADSYLVPDYETLIASDTTQSLADLLFPSFSQITENQENTQKNITPAIHSETNLITPYPIDASQENALHAVKEGKSIVIQGPPGTGKSQLICNLVCDFLAQGKKVLVVCQKRAALDVVHQRLADKNFADFAALVHDIQSDRKTIFEQIKTHIENIEDYRKKNESFDVLYAETKFTKLCLQIDKITEELTKLKIALYDTDLCGISIKELYLTSPKTKDILSSSALWQLFERETITFHQYTELFSHQKTYLRYALLDTHTFWQNRVSLANFSVQDKNIIADLLQKIPKTWQDLQENIAIQIDKKLDFQTTKNLLAQETEILDFVKREVGTHESYIRLWTLLKNKVSQEDFAIFQKLLQKIGKELKKKENIEQTLLTDNIATYNLYLQKYFLHQENFVRKMLWNFAKEKKPLQELAQKNDLLLTVENAKILQKKIKKRTDFEKLRNQLKEISWAITFDFVDYSFDYQEFNSVIENYEKAQEAKKIWEKFSKSILGTDVYDIEAYDKFVHQIEKVMNLCKDFHATFMTWQQYFSENQLLTLLQSSEENIAEYSKNLHKNFSILKEFDTFQSQILPSEIKLGQALRQKLYSVIEQNSSSETNTQTIIDTILKEFDQNLRLYWIEKIENQFPILTSVSSFRIEHLEEELQQFLAEKTKLSTDLLHQKLREQTYTSLNFNRLNNLVSYRDLKHQVNKKRHVFPLRKLLQHHHEEIFNLIPCWLASPETVSAMFEMKEMFDLVIFDEASQCFAEKGLPAVFRGKQVVIAGDSQQLQPFDLYRPRWEEEFDEDMELQAALEVDSLLDLGANELPSFMLKGHYRSKSLDLIDFSNQVFYKKQLHMIPNYVEFMQEEPAIEYVKVEGVWEKNSNLAEAQKIAELIQKLQRENKTSIGVIAFNIHQQNLILDVLEERNIALSSDVFVKNIENVQGDEREIIIFSLGYAPSPSGRMNMQFGLLNLAKGENRLNVAITRAKEKIYVIASIFPHQLQVEHLQNDGVKLLKSYLEYALEVSERRYQPILPNPSQQNIDWYLKNKLINSEQDLIIDLPFADITVRQSSDYELILTDDDLFYKALSAKEWFAYLPTQLKNKGWKFARSWSRNWWGKD